jgi:hypothetical protein
MTSQDNQLFTAEEALFRLGQNKGQGCLLVSKGSELISIYVQNGFVLSATSGAKKGQDALDYALHLTEASYQWIRGVQTPDPSGNTYLNIEEFLFKHGNLTKTKIADTGRLHTKAMSSANDIKYTYFLVPENQPTVKHYLTKTATVLGRDKSSDLLIDDNNVSGRHCILDIQNRGLFVLDLDSTNGTYVNDVFVRDGYVNHGDILELGSYRLTINREVRKERDQKSS